MRDARFSFSAYAGRRAQRVDLSRFIEGVTAVINDALDTAMDGVLDAVDAIPFTVEDLQEQIQGTRECFRGWRWQEWKDDDDPAEAMR
jgi:hypothetical protein